MTDEGAERARAAIDAVGIDYTVTTHGHVGSLQEAALARGVSPDAVIKTMVVRKGEDDYVLVLVPGDRTIAWPKLRELLGVNRLSMPDADAAFAATGYRRGTITPFGAHRNWPVVADASLVARAVSIGGGASGVAFTVDGDDLIGALDATVADISEASPPAASR